MPNDPGLPRECDAKARPTAESRRFRNIAFERWRAREAPPRRGQGCAFQNEDIAGEVSAPPNGGTGLDACSTGGEYNPPEARMPAGCSRLRAAA